METAGEQYQPRIGLLILQPTPFCNINCDYCYLPDRTSSVRMSMTVLSKAIATVFDSGLVQKELSIVWHAGEPTALPISFYEEAFQVIRDQSSMANMANKVFYSFQTNGTLINERWCAFIKETGIRVGLSIDGPGFIHDAHRKTRRGQGTHAQVMKGVELLRKHEIEFHVIAVVTEKSLAYADEIFEFFLNNGIRRVGFNIEEIEGVNRSSSLSGDVETRVKRFWSRMHLLQKESCGAVQIREFDRAYNAIAFSARPGANAAVSINDQTTPFGIVSIDHLGNVSTFSPELLGMKSAEFGNFCFGNVMEHELLDIVENNNFKQINEDIRFGIRNCAATCEYYPFCGGGAPSNKYFENKSFASTETLYCRYSVKAPLDVVLADLENAASVSTPDFQLSGAER